MMDPDDQDGDPESHEGENPHGEGGQPMRPATVDDVKRLITIFNERRVPYLLVGGFALAAHGYMRATTDIDLLFPAQVEVGELVRDALMLLPQGVAKDIDPEWFLEGENIRVNDEITIDVMMNVNGNFFADMQMYAQTVMLDDVPVSTVSLEGLLVTKMTVRPKDQEDARLLEQAIQAAKRQAIEK